jgi:hypothetical protein
MNSWEHPQKQMSKAEKNFWNAYNQRNFASYNNFQNLPNNMFHPVNLDKQQQLQNVIRNSKYNVLGKGAYGSIIKPALPNVIQNDILLYPNNVTKIFTAPPDVSKLETLGSMLKADKDAHFSPDMLHRYSVFSYHYPYRNTNIHASSNLEKDFPNLPKNMELNPLLLRLPFLGNSFLDIVMNKGDIKQKVSRQTQQDYETVCEQIMECLKVLRTIKKNDYIHGDVRETNVMLHPDTNEMTIIDYDWLYPSEDFFERYPYYMYHLPPECLFVFGHKGNYDDNWMFFRSGKDNGMNRDDLIEMLNLYRKDGINYFYHSNELADALLKFIRIGNHQQLFLDDQFEILRRRMFGFIKGQIDSYGFAYSLRCLFDTCGKTDGIWSLKMLRNDDLRFIKIRDFILNALIPNMMHSNAFKRWDVDRAILELDHQMTQLQIGLHGGKKNRTKNGTRKSRKIKKTGKRRATIHRNLHKKKEKSHKN